MTDTAADEQNRADRRGDVAQAHIEDQHNAELDLRHAKAGSDGQEDRGENQDGRGDVHEHADDQQVDVHEQEDDVLVVSQAHQAVGDGCRDAGVGHNKGHGRGGRDQEQDDAGRFGGVEQDAKEAFEVDALIDDGKNQAVEKAEYFAESIGRMAYQALLEEVYTVPRPGLVDPYSCGAHTDMDVQTLERSAEALYPWFVRMAYQGYQLTCTPEDLFREIRKPGMLAEEAMYRATGHVNTHKGMIFTLGIFSAAAGRCIQEDGTVTLQSILRMEQKMTARILRAEIEMLGKEPAKSNGEKNLVQYGTTGIRGEALAGYPSVFHIALPVLEDGLLRGMEWNRIKLQILFAVMSRVQDSNILSRKNPSVLYQVQMEAMQFLEEGGAYSEDALDKLIRMDADYIKRGISAGGCADLLATSLFLAMLCNKIPNENGAILNLFPVVK